MTRETAREYLPLVQALADGKSLQVLIGGQWVDEPKPMLDAYFPSTWRIKPEPRRWWLWGEVAYQSRTAAEKVAKSHGDGFTPVIEVMEVIK